MYRGGEAVRYRMIPPVLSHLYEAARTAKATIVLPEAEDPRVIEAADRIKAEQIAEPILLHAGAFDRLDAAIQQVLVDVLLASKLAKDGFDVATARLLLSADTKYLAAAMVQAGQADGYVAGSICTTAETIRPALKVIGVRDGFASSFFLMLFGEAPLFFADSGFNIEPDAAQLARIAIDTANSARLLGVDPSVAFLSFSTKGSAEHPRVTKVREALRIARELAPELPMDGELQFDAAFVPGIGERKAPNSPVAGHANVFVFPDLDSGNIAYKIAERIGGCRAIGPLMQGLDKPVNDLSRGCSVQDIVDAVAFTALQAGGTLEA